MSVLSLQSQRQLNLFRRQYLQLQAPIKYPEPVSLRQEVFQQTLYDTIFKDGTLPYEPPIRYKLRVLKELIIRIEASISNWEEEGISDDLMSELSALLLSSLPPEAVAAQQRTYVTYTLSSITEGDPPPTITLLEARNLLLASGTTGLRTWEASLHMSNYLASSGCAFDLQGQNILELGSGTGYLSVFCSKYLNAAHVIATDGSDDVIADLATNFYLNGLQSSTIVQAKELKWGQALLGGEQSEWNEGRDIDFILAADVTYDIGAQPALVATIFDLAVMYSRATILISATIRNEQTWANFVKICGMNGFLLEDIDFPVILPEDQEGPFYWDGIPIKVCVIRKEDDGRNPKVLHHHSR